MNAHKPAKSSQPSRLTCSICGRRFYLDETDSPPFCSERCKMVDLGRWLDEKIEIPHEGGLENDEGEESAEG